MTQKPSAGTAPPADVTSYVGRVLGIQGNGLADTAVSPDAKKVTSTVEVLRGYSEEYGLCSENTLANQWYMDNFVKDDEEIRKQMQCILKNDRLSQDQKIESQYAILKNKLNGEGSSLEDKKKWENISKDKGEIDKTYSTKKSAPKDSKEGKKIVKNCSIPKSFNNCVQRAANEEVVTHTQEMYNKINNDNNTNIDFKLIEKFENGNKPPSTSGFVPWGKGASSNKSGVTVATGFDIGQMNKDDLKKYKFSKDLEDKISPYLGLKRQDACNKLALHPMDPLTKEEILAIDSAKFNEVVQQTKQNWNKLNPKTPFEGLSPERQTVLFSRSFQYGSGWMKSSNKFIAEAIQDNWTSAQSVYSSSNAYANRTKKELELLEKALNAGEVK